MYVRYGNYTHADSEVGISISRQPLRNEGGMQHGFVETWRLQGFLQADSQAALNTAIAALKSAYSFNGRDLVLLDNTGTVTTHAMYTKNCYGGTRVTSAPEFPSSEGGEFTTYRQYSITVEGRVLDNRIPLLAFHESVSIQGTGDGKFVHQIPLTGPPIKQMVSTHSIVTATQQGSAIGQFSYPLVPAPLWPAAEKRERRSIVRDSPKREGPLGQPQFSEFRINWSYQFESAVPLLSTPHRFPG